MGLIRLKSRCQRAAFLWSFWGEIRFLVFPASGGCPHPLSLGPFLPAIVSLQPVFPLSRLILCLICLPLSFISTLVIATDNLKSLNFIIPAKPFRHIRKYIHRFWGLQDGHLWGSLFCHPTPPPPPASIGLLPVQIPRTLPVVRNFPSWWEGSCRILPSL